VTRSEATPAETTSPLAAAHVGHGWLAAVLPADAAVISVADRDLAETLRLAGAELVNAGGDVEIGPLSAIQGVAPHVVVPVQAAAETSRILGRRTRRLAAYAEVRTRAATIRRGLRQRGYGDVAVLAWDLEQVIQVAGGPGQPHASRSARYPRRAVVVACRAGRVETLLERATREASDLAGVALDARAPLLRAGTLVALGDEGVLRLAVGPGERQIDAQDRALADLAAASSADVIAARTPDILASGRSGLARWTLESRVPGRPSPHDLADPVLADCLDFLVSLHSIGGNGQKESLVPQAALVGELLGSGEAGRLLDAAETADAELADVRRGFGHGDFCTSNLLVEGERLSGVVDWDAGGHGRLPLLDLFHLRLLAETRAAPYQWGAAVTSYLLPLAATGGDAVVERYCRTLELEVSRSQLQQLAFAYWLQRVAYQLGMYVDRSRDRTWLRRNVGAVCGRFIAGATGQSV
jgi:aminoglycoside phosphotransferase (APT) family kinase protein